MAVNSGSESEGSDGEGVEFRPPSPKYDEAGFFMATGEHPWVADSASTLSDGLFV